MFASIVSIYLFIVIVEIQGWHETIISLKWLDKHEIDPKTGNTHFVTRHNAMCVDVFWGDCIKHKVTYVDTVYDTGCTKSSST